MCGKEALAGDKVVTSKRSFERCFEKTANKQQSKQE
jgi:hypothetical protein